MNRKQCLTVVIVCAVLMFAWILLAFILTDGRETSDFRPSDFYILIGLIVLELVTCGVMFYFAQKCGKMLKVVPVPLPKGVPQGRGLLLITIALLLSVLASVLGTSVGGSISVPVLQWMLFGGSAGLLLLFPLNLLLRRQCDKILERKSVSEMQQYLFSHRASAEETSVRKRTLLGRIRRLTEAYTVLLGVLAFGMSFCAGALLQSGFSVPFCFAAAVFLLAALSRIHLPLSKTVFEGDKTYVSAEEYPALYALANRARDTLHCNGQIRIALLPDFNAGIAKVGSFYSVQLGVILLQIYSQGELYAILLHEFAHMTGEGKLSEKEHLYHSRLYGNDNQHFLSRVTSVLFYGADVYYDMEYTLYLYASSLLREAEADQAMAHYGNASAAASALLKLKYYDLFNWEKGTQDKPCVFAPEQPEAHLLADEVASFEESISQHAADWDTLMNAEILARSATHPTTRMRLAALGITEPQLIMPVEATETAYRNDCDKALQYLDELVFENRCERYAEDRRENYLEPKAHVEAWEAAGRPLIAEEYADIVKALRQLGRVTEAMSLCERAIEELPDAAACFACYIKGCFLLHRCDADGLAYVYRAIQGNHNYWQEGLEIIGTFCCLTGRQEELDRYREKAEALMQEDRDIYSQIDALRKGDRLSGEHLPDGMLEDILTYIRAVDGGTIEKIYLVRKTVTEDFFTSAFVIRFAPQTEQSVQNEVMHKIFSYLDTCSDWQFSLFDYADVAKLHIERITGSCVYYNPQTRGDSPSVHSDV